MTRSRCFFVIFLLALSTLAAACSSDSEPSGPTLTLSTERVPDQGWVYVHGTGFTPNANVTSHLLRPDGTEFPWLPILTDGNGEFTHEIDSRLLLVGTHQTWVEDDTTGVSSNVARFEVTREQPPAG